MSGEWHTWVEPILLLQKQPLRVSGHTLPPWSPATWLQSAPGSDAEVGKWWLRIKRTVGAVGNPDGCLVLWAPWQAGISCFASLHASNAFKLDFIELPVRMGVQMSLLHVYILDGGKPSPATRLISSELAKTLLELCFPLVCLPSAPWRLLTSPHHMPWGGG